MIREEWRDVAGLAGVQVSNRGSMRYVKKDGSPKSGPRPSISECEGVKEVRLEVDGDRRYISVAALVLEAFSEEEFDPSSSIEYADGNPWNCSLDNLIVKHEVAHLDVVPESWRQIPDFPNYYVSDQGEVRHRDRPKPRRQSINEKGFPIIVLFKDDSKTRYLRQINGLVASAFLPKEYDVFGGEKTHVWHIDGDFSNCRLENLKWETRTRVLEWNEMHRSGEPKLSTPRVKANRTGKIYSNAFECAMDYGMLESDVVWRIERINEDVFDENAEFCYVPKSAAL